MPLAGPHPPGVVWKSRKHWASEAKEKSTREAGSRGIPTRATDKRQRSHRSRLYSEGPVSSARIPVHDKVRKPFVRMGIKGRETMFNVPLVAHDALAHWLRALWLHSESHRAVALIAHPDCVTFLCSSPVGGCCRPCRATTGILGAFELQCNCHFLQVQDPGSRSPLSLDVLGSVL